MFGFLKKKDPLARLRREYAACMKAAVDLQRAGDIKGFARKTAEAAELEKRLAEAERAG